MAIITEERQRREPRKKKIQLYYDRTIQVLDSLNNEQLGAWFRAIFNYELFGGEIPTTGDVATDIFIKITTPDIDRGIEAFISTCEKNKANRNSNKAESAEEDSPEAQRNFMRLTSKEY